MLAPWLPNISSVAYSPLTHVLSEAAWAYMVYMVRYSVTGDAADELLPESPTVCPGDRVVWVGRVSSTRGAEPQQGVGANWQGEVGEGRVGVACSQRSA
jgi:hypothetical protein